MVSVGMYLDLDLCAYIREDANNVAHYEEIPFTNVRRDVGSASARNVTSE